MELDRSGLEVLSHQECLRLLATTSLGRIAVTSDAMPLVLPVRFGMLDDDIVVRTAQGSRLDGATRGAVVAFEADHLAPSGDDGWSVALVGVAQDLAGPRALLRAEGLGLPEWGGGRPNRYVSLSTERMTGRRFTTSTAHTPSGPGDGRLS